MNSASSTCRSSVSEESPPPGASQSLFDLALLWRRKWSLILAAVISVGVGVAYLLVATPVFEVDARLLVQKEGFAFQIERSRREDREFLATQAEIIRSPLTVRLALKSAPLTGLSPEADPVKVALASLRVKPLLNTDVLKITFRGEDPEETIQFVEAVIESYRQQLSTVERDVNAKTLELLSQRDEDLRSKLESLQQQYVQHRKSSPLIGHGRDAVSIDSELLRQLSQQLAEIRRHRVGIENTIQTLEVYRDAVARGKTKGALVFTSASSPPVAEAPRKNSDARPTGANISDEHRLYKTMAAHLLGAATAGVQQLDVLHTELRQAISHEQELAEVYGLQHPQRRSAISQVATLKELIRRQENDASGILEQELAVAKSTEKNLAEMYNRERNHVKSLDNFLIREQQLLENIRRVQAVHDSTLTQFNELTLAGQSINTGRPSVTVRLLEEPQSTLHQVWPNKPSLLLVCMFLGLTCGAAWVTISERRIGNLRSEG